ncbi:MAG: T9SS type A sorting domain-containing protein [Chitinophagaceae bacterium]|nr:T9SS type A sorting domain-containing protein [Chitinophagaceae bacterium]
MWEQVTAKLSGNSYLTVSGKNILNNAVIPNGGSSSNTGAFNNEGAATGSIQINVNKVTQLVFKVYLRGCDASQFGWSSAGIGVVSNATRTPLTGDIWYISTSLSPCVGCISLPTTGLSLTAALNGNDVSLNWKTLTESNTKSFDIERSTDGINYVKVGEKAAAGNSVSDINYSHIDPNMNVPVYYYRLKMVDLDSRYSYSNVVIVRKSLIKGIKAFPNPATDHVNIEFSNAKGSYTVSLLNQLGQQVYSKKVDINNTVQYIRIERGTIPAGMYHVSIRDNNSGELQSEKVLIK